MTKKLYILTSDRGDGSRGVHFTLNKEWIDAQQARFNNDELDYDSIGVDGDGFSYLTLNVSDDATLESLGIHWDVAEDD